MPATDYAQRLIDRQTTLKARVNAAAEATTLAEARLTQARQRLAIAQGELKAVTQVVDEQTAASQEATPTQAVPSS